METEPTLIDDSIVRVLRFRIKDAPLIQPRLASYKIKPDYVEVEMFTRGTRAKVFGRSTYDGTIRAMIFNVTGYDKNVSAPDWLIKLIGQARVREAQL